MGADSELPEADSDELCGRERSLGGRERILSGRELMAGSGF